MFGCESAAAAGGLALEALDELVVLGEVVVQDLDRQVPTQQLVLGQVHVGHAAGAEARDHPVAAVDDGVGLDHREQAFHHFTGHGSGERGALPGDVLERHGDGHARGR